MKPGTMREHSFYPSGPTLALEPVYSYDTQSHIKIGFVYRDGDGNMRHTVLYINATNQGESLMLQIRASRASKTSGLPRMVGAFIDALNMRRDAVYLVSASTVIII